jgi:hypothetical protein
LSSFISPPAAVSRHEDETGQLAIDRRLIPPHRGHAQFLAQALRLVALLEHEVDLLPG